MPEIYANGELFVYCNGDRWELGQVKSPNNTGDGYFCWYSTGDTAANTPVEHMHKLANAGWSHVERACVVESTEYDELLDAEYVNLDCGHSFEWSNSDIELPNYCPYCGRRVE